MKIRQAKAGDEDQALARELFWEYLQWANGRVNEEFGVNFDIADMLEEDVSEREKFFPPDGRLLLASEDSRVVGIGCLKKLGQGVGEIKRMYVKPEFQGKGIGRAILEGLISEAKQIGYQRLRLDSAGFMHAAHSLYRAAGFADIAPYAESEIPADFQGHWVFMEKRLL